MLIDLDSLRVRAEELTVTEYIVPTLGLTRSAASPTKAAATAKKFRYAMEMASDIDNLVADEYRIESLMPVHGLMTVYGAPGDGKSFLVLDAVMHVACGLPYFGKKVQQGSVVYIAAEGGSGMRKRIKAWRHVHEIEHVPLALITAAPNLGANVNSLSDADLLVDDIRAQVSALGSNPSVIVVDTLARTLPGAEENSSSGMGNFIDNARKLSEAFDKCLVIAVHHTGKNADKGMRGHSSLHGATDAEWRLSSDSSGEKTVTLEKMKDGTGRLSWSFSLKQVVLPATSSSNEHGTISTCVIDPVADPGSAHSGVAEVKGNDALVLQAVQELWNPAEGRSNHSIVDRPSIVRSAVHELASRKGVGDPSNAKSQKAMINRSIVSLKSKGLVEVDGDLLRLIEAETGNTP